MIQGDLHSRQIVDDVRRCEATYYPLRIQILITIHISEEVPKATYCSRRISQF